MATVVKGFEKMNLPLTRRKFLSIVKKEKERKSKFCFEKLLLLGESAGFLCCCSEVMFRPPLLSPGSHRPRLALEFACVLLSSSLHFQCF